MTADINNILVSPGIYAYFTILTFLWGACVGSFLNVCIHRIPNGLSVVTPRSHCPVCRHKIAWYNNIPLLSWNILRGRCADCGSAIPPRYVLVELLVAILFLLTWFKFTCSLGICHFQLTPTNDPRLIPVFWLVLAGLTTGAFIDIEHLIIPDRITLGGIFAGLVISTVLPSLHNAQTSLDGLKISAIGCAAGWGSLWIVAALGKAVFKKEAMGFGDVKLMGAVGAFLGWRAVIFTITVSSLFGSIVGLTLIAAHRRKLQSRIPYGPYISLAAAVWIFWGPSLWDAYFNLLSGR